MATNNEINMSSFGTLAPKLQSIVDDLCATLEFELSTESYVKVKNILRKARVDLDIALYLDVQEPADIFTEFWIANFCAVQVAIESIDPNKPDAYILLSTCLDKLLGMITLVPKCSFEVSDDDISLPDFSYEDPPTDLTEEGIEPNPGPDTNDPTPRHNRYRGDAKLQSKRESRAAKKELQCYIRLVEQAQKNKVKLSTLFEDVAQIGGSPTTTLLPEERQVPPPECPNCGKQYCECMIKKLSATAATFSIAQSIVKIIDIISHWLTIDHAQMGVTSIFPWLIGATPTIDNANTLINEATERIQSIPTADEVMAKVSSTVKDVLDSNCGFLPVSVRTVLVTLCTAVGLFIIYKTGRIAYSVVMMPLRYMIGSMHNAAELIHTLTYFFGREPENKDKAQAGLGDVLSYLPMAGAMAATLMITYLTGKIPSRDNTAFGLLTKIGTVPRAAAGFTEILKWCHNTIIIIWDWVRVKVLGYDPSMLEGAVPELTAWMRDVEDRMSSEYLATTCADYTGRYKAAMLYINGHNLMRKYHDALTPELKQAMMRMMVQAARIRTQVETQFPEVKTIRTVPLPIWLVGESQIGKSTLCYLISTELCMSAGVTSPKDQIYQRCVEQEYWDGYMNQFIALYDDLGQMKDAVSAPNLEFFELIRAIGPFPYPLHMADITQKATTQFTSKVILASTNDLNLRIESLTYPDAVWNRLTQSWFVKVKPKYLMQDKNGNVLEPQRLNIERVVEDSPVLNGKKWKINPYIYDFVKFNARSRNIKDRDNGECVGWDAFIKILKDDLASRSGRGKELDDFLAEYVEAHKQTAQMGEEIATEKPDPIVYAAENVFPHAQIGSVPTHTFHELAAWALDQTIPFTNSKEYDLAYYHMALGYELEEVAGQPPHDLRTFVPSIIPPEPWQALVMSFYRAKYAPKSNVENIMARVSNFAKLAFDRLPSYVKEFLDVMASLVKWLADFCIKNTTLLIGLLVAFLSMSAFEKSPQVELYKQREAALSRPEFDPGEIVEQAESDTRNQQPKARAQQRTVATARVRVVNRNVAEMGQSWGQLDIIAKFRRQQYHLTMVLQDGSHVPMGTITNVTGQLYMMPNHFVMALESRKPVSIIMANTKVVIEKPFVGWYDVENSIELVGPDGNPRDLVLICIKEIQKGCDLTKHFASLDDLSKLHDRRFQATLSGVDIEKTVPTNTSSSGNCTLMFENVHLDYHCEGDVMRTTNIATHQIPTKSGDCGKIISVNTDALSGRVFGIHISGSPSGHNHAQVISREELMAAIKAAPSYAQCGHAFSDLKPTKDPFGKGFIPLGQAPFSVPQSNRTQIVKSKLYGKLIEPLTRPAVLKPTEVTIDGATFIKDPLLEGARKAGSKCGFVDPHILEMAEMDVKVQLATKFVPDGPTIEVLSYEQAVKGIEGDELFAPINRTTSPGWPYSQMPKPAGCPGKTYFFGKYEWELDTPQAALVKQNVEELIKKCENDQTAEIVFIDTLKDERLPHAKVDIAKTRIISNGPMDYSIAFRQYFMGATAHIRHNRIFNGIAIGMNVWSSEWHLLATHLLANSPHMIDGDFTNYDGTLMDQVMWSVFRVFDSLYDDGNTTIRRNLWHAACYATRYNQGHLYQCTHSLPSGFPVTAEANSIYELILFRCAYVQLARESGNSHLANMRDFNRFVRMITYGDDNLLSISAEILSWFNMHTLVGAMAKFGMTYTTAQKDLNYKASKTIADVSFLKRSFTRVDTGHGILPVYSCPAPLDSRLDILNWTKFRKLGSEAEESDAVTSVLQELAVHGKSVYEEWGKKVVKAAIEAELSGFVYEPLMSHLMKFMTGDPYSPSQSRIVPHQCDLIVARQNSDVEKGDDTAIGGRGVVVQPYTLGSPVAAPQYPREHQSDGGLSGSQS